MAGGGASARHRSLSSFFTPTAKLGTGSFYFETYYDSGTVTLTVGFELMCYNSPRQSLPCGSFANLSKTPRISWSQALPIAPLATSSVVHIQLRAGS